MKHCKYRILSCILLCALLLTALPAQAASHSGTGSYQTYVIKNTMPVYQYPSPLSRLMGTMSYGEGVKVLAWQDNWIRVQNSKGQIGYCEFGGLSTKNPNTLNMKGYVKESGAFVFSKPATGYKAIAAVPMGTQLNAVAMTPDKKWVRVRNGSRYGYVQASLLSKTPTVDTPDVDDGVAERIWIVSSGACSISATPGGFDDVGTVSHGQDYELLEVRGNYAHLRNHKGKTGWISADNISKTNPNNMEKTMYAQVGGKLLYANSIVRGSAGSLKKDQAVTVVAQSVGGSWYRVRIGGKYYYVQDEFLAETKAPEGGRVMQCGLDGMTVYKTSEISSDVVARLVKGEKVQLIGAGKNGGRKIRTQSGVVGYVANGLEPV